MWLNFYGVKSGSIFKKFTITLNSVEKRRKVRKLDGSAHTFLRVGESLFAKTRTKEKGRGDPV